MDTSKEYIRMCEKVPDEMKQKFHGQTDWYVYIEIAEIKGIFIFSDIALQIKGRAGIIFPIFRQDQLQNIIIDKFSEYPTSLDGMLLNFHFFSEEVRKFNSMEQYWLAFVMKEKYGKTWNGKEWQES